MGVKLEGTLERCALLTQSPRQNAVDTLLRGRGKVFQNVIFDLLTNIRRVSDVIILYTTPGTR